MGKIKKRRNRNKRFNKYLSFISFCILLLLVLSFIIFNTDYLSPKIDYITSSYISFNDIFSTDSMKIRNISIMSDKNGMSLRNKSYVSFNVDGVKSYSYKIVLYSYGNDISSEYIRINLKKNGEDVCINNLDKFTTLTDGGIVIYEDKISGNDKYDLKMWISKDFDGDYNNTAYEVKIES